MFRSIFFVAALAASSLVLLSCGGAQKIPDGVWEASYGPSGFTLRVKNDGKGIARFALQDFAQQMRWMDVVCDRCGEDQLDLPGEGLLLIKWGSPDVGYSGEKKVLSLEAPIVRADGITWVPFRFLDRLGYSVEYSAASQKLIVAAGLAVEKRLARAATLPPKPILSYAELKAKLDEGTVWNGESAAVQPAAIALVDVRTREEFSEGHIPGAVNIPIDDLKKAVPAWPKDHLIVVYCLKGARSTQAEVVLRRQGFETIINFGAISNWQGPLAK